jgi:hypothetical protein
MNTATIPAEVAAYLADIIEEDLDRRAEHLIWLASHPDEHGRDRQRAETERAIELAKLAAALFPATFVDDAAPDPGSPGQAA